jgi:ribose/xylose/arabinose/galactoside ABC-type transport system permease subunit
LARELSLEERRLGRSQLSVYWEHARETWSRFPESGALFGFASVLIFFIIATWANTGWPPQIIDGRSIASITTNAASQGIIAVGVTMLMISGEFDLSVGSMLGLSALMFIIAAESGPAGLVELIPGIGDQLVANYDIPTRIGADGVAALFAIAVALITGALLGLINGLLLVATRIPSFIVTLGTLYIYRSVMLNIIPGGTIARYTREEMVWSFPAAVLIVLIIAIAGIMLVLLWPTLRNSWSRVQLDTERGAGPLIGLLLAGLIALVVIGVSLRLIVLYAEDISSTVAAPFFDIMNGKFAFVPENFRSAIFWWLLMAVIFTIILTQTRYGNATFAAGGNPEAARAQGVNVRRVKVMNFVISGMLAAVAGITEAARFKVVEPLRGTGYELDVIAATVIGGTLLTGGYGSIIGTVLGILIAFMLKTGLVLIGVEADWFRGVLGIIMIVAVIINTNIRRQR